MTPTHVVPLNDLREHDTDGGQCWCRPDIEEDGLLIVHHSMDQRERYEPDGDLTPH